VPHALPSALQLADDSGKMHWITAMTRLATGTLTRPEGIRYTACKVSMAIMRPSVPPRSHGLREWGALLTARSTARAPGKWQRPPSTPD